jgi:hypothetical protein
MKKRYVHSDTPRIKLDGTLSPDSRGCPIKNYDNFDWQLRDVDLAKERHLSRERVRQIRKERGIEKSPLYRMKSTTLAVMSVLPPTGELTEFKPILDETYKQFPHLSIGPRRAYSLRKQYGIKFARKKSPHPPLSMAHRAKISARMLSTWVLLKSKGQNRLKNLSKIP